MVKKIIKIKWSFKKHCVYKKKKIDLEEKKETGSSLYNNNNRHTHNPVYINEYDYV